MKQKNLRLVILLALTCLGLTGMKAEKIDATHYRFPIMADFGIVDEKVAELRSNGCEIIESKWNVDSHLMALGEGWDYNQFFLAITPGYSSIFHNIKYRFNGCVESTVTIIDVEIVAPESFMVKSYPLLWESGESFPIECGFLVNKDMPAYPNKGGIVYSFSSSNPNVLSISANGVGTAKSKGKTTIRVEALAQNSTWGTDTYRLGWEEREIEVTSHIESSSLIFEPENIITYIGKKNRLFVRNSNKDGVTLNFSNGINSEIYELSNRDYKLIFYPQKSEKFTISASSCRGYLATCMVEVREGFTNEDFVFDICDDNFNGVKVVDYNNSSATSLSVPSQIIYQEKKYDVVRIEHHAFSEVCNLNSIIFPNTLKEIGFDAFSSTKLTSLRLPNHLESIESNAFNWCESLVSVQVGTSLQSVGNTAFGNCTTIKSVYIKELGAWCGIQFGDETANPLCAGNADLYLNGEKVTNLVIPDNTTEVGNYAFTGCASIESVSLHDKVTLIGSRAFANCSGLKRVDCHAMTPPSLTQVENDSDESFAFDGIYEKAILHVPHGCGEAYESAPGWNRFNVIIEDLEAGIEDVLMGDESGGIKLYDLNGVELSLTHDKLMPGIYIERNGHSTRKIVVK